MSITRQLVCEASVFVLLYSTPRIRARARPCFKLDVDVDIDSDVTHRRRQLFDRVISGTQFTCVTSFNLLCQFLDVDKS
jgi:hypothetical protein